jgi:hypothetical protein
MKFYLYNKPAYYRLTDLRDKIHIAADEHDPQAGCLCGASVNPGSWKLVEKLPEVSRLCPTCRHLANTLWL